MLTYAFNSPAGHWLVYIILCVLEVRMPSRVVVGGRLLTAQWLERRGVVEVLRRRHVRRLHRKCSQLRPLHTAVAVPRVVLYTVHAVLHRTESFRLLRLQQLLTDSGQAGGKVLRGL